VAQSASNIFVGPARVFVGVTNPASGTPPTLLTHTAGVPGTGTEIGFTDGDANWHYKATKEEIMAEQSLAPVDVFTKQEEIVVKFTMLESNYTALQVAFDNVGKVDDGSKTLMYGGGGTSILAPTTQSVVLTSPHRLAPTKFSIFVAYKIYSVLGYESVLSKSKKRAINVELHGIADTSRNAGDTLFQVFEEK
jgi:hypothetical protein